MMIELRNAKKYELIAGQIEQMILDSEMKPGDRMLSIQKLYRHFGAAPATVCNALNLLRERGIITSVPQKGTFISRIPDSPVPEGEELSEADITSYLENALSMTSFFIPSRKSITISLREYNSNVHREMWDRIFEAFREQHNNIDIQVDADPGDSSESDIIMFVDNLHPQNMLESPEIRAELDMDSAAESYFPIAMKALMGNHYPARPFSISQAWKIYHRELLEKHCPDLRDGDFQHLIHTVIDRFDYRDESFPALGTFVQFLPLNLIEEGIIEDGFAPINFDDPRIHEILEFNRCMIHKIRKYHQGTNDFSIGLLWGDFMKGYLMGLDTFSYVLRLLAESKNDDILVRAASGSNHAATRVQLLGVAADSPNTQEAVEFIRFACGAQGQQILAESRCNIPALRDSAENDVFLKNTPSGVDRDLLKNLYRKESLLDAPTFNNEVVFGKVNSILSAYYFDRIDLNTAVRKLKHIRFI